MNSETRNCQSCKKDFIIEAEDFDFYKKIEVPAPTFCSECRLIRRLGRRNERSFFRRTCDKCKKWVISVWHLESNMAVYCSPCWWSDSWDGLKYGVDFNPSEPFLIQLDQLFHRVPVMSLFGLYTTLVNSDYTNMVGWLKNCYMVTYSDYCEEVVYGSFVNHTKDSVDNLMAENCELCYETVNCNKCYRTFFSVDCESCNNVYFSKNCMGCNDCFGCVNLRNKSYCLYNEQLSKEDYEKRIAELLPTTAEKIARAKTELQEFWKPFPQKYMHGWHNVNSTGDYLNDTKNTKNSFVGFNIEDSKFCTMTTGKMTDTYDFTNFGLNSSLLYECLQVGNQVARSKFGWWVITSCQDVDYGMFVIGSKNLFGCVGLKKREYCILNKQYTKEEYEKLRTQIIEQMNAMPYKDKQGLIYKYGEFFPLDTSPFAYNETSAQEFFPLTKEEALKKGYIWRDPEKKEKVASGNDIIACERCTSQFRVVPQETGFYERVGLPVPHFCPNCRNAERIKMRNPLKLWHRKCMKDGCQNEFETSYAPDRPEIVYCESCYQQEVT